MRRGRPLAVTWAESAEELEARLATERDARRRERLLALLLVRQGRRIYEVSDAVGVNYRTIQRWIDWYRSGGVDMVLLRTPGYNAPGRRSKLNERQMHELLQAYEAGVIESTRDAVDWTLERYGVQFSYTGMIALLKRVRNREQTSRQHEWAGDT